MENNLKNSTVFPLGGKMESENFSGDVWLQMLVPREDIYNCPIGNVTFSPGCRNSWHVHPGGQILLVTGGCGWYQEDGKPARRLQTGDVVMIPPEVKHWHGAAKDSWFVHLSVEANPQAGAAVWLEPVEDEVYDRLE